MAEPQSNALALTNFRALEQTEIDAIRAMNDVALQKLWDDTAQRAERNAAAMGVMLQEWKRRLPHGDWLKWLNSNFGKTHRTARNLMQLARIVEEEQQPPANRQPVAGLPEPANYKRTLREHAQPRPPRVVVREVQPEVTREMCTCPTCGDIHTRELLPL